MTECNFIHVSWGMRKMDKAWMDCYKEEYDVCPPYCRYCGKPCKPGSYADGYYPYYFENSCHISCRNKAIKDKAEIEDTIKLIKKLHKGQTDKSGKPYWKHPVAVMELLPRKASQEERLGALLHDVLEDTETTKKDLKEMGYSDEVVEIVDLVSRPQNMVYREWIESLAASGNEKAINVKLVDVEHNMSPKRMKKLPPETQKSLSKRYEMTLEILKKDKA